MFPNTLVLLPSRGEAFQFSASHECGFSDLFLMIEEMEMMVYNPRLSCKSPPLSACSFSFWTISLREASCCVMRTLEQPWREVHELEEFKTSCQQPAGNWGLFSQPCEWAILGGTRSPSHLLRFSLTGAAWCSGRQVAKIMEVPKGQKSRYSFSRSSSFQLI